MSTRTDKPILICFDGSAGARRAIEVAGTLFGGHRAIVAHTWTRVGAAFGFVFPVPADDEIQLKRGALELAQDGVRLAAAAGLEATPEIREASFEGCAHALLRLAELHDASLIVMGARGLSTFKSVVLGSVSHGVVQHAHCPVLIVPPAAPASRVGTRHAVASATA